MWKRLFKLPNSSVREKKTILLDGQMINFTLIKKNKKNISLKVSHTGLIVAVPFNTTQSYIEEVIHKKSKWILKTLPKITYFEKNKSQINKILIFGNNYHIDYDCNDTKINCMLNKLYIKKCENKNKELKSFLKTYAQEFFNSRLQNYQHLVENKIDNIELTNARTKWGSCSNSKKIRLNWRLIHAKIEIIDYVLCHELAHLKFMNHSEFFWNEVKRIYPNYEIYRRDLTKQSLDFFVVN